MEKKPEKRLFQP